MRKRKRIYLDTAAATPVDPRVERAMWPFLARNFGNPASLHEEGVAAAEALADARAKTAHILGARANEIIFTSGGTEGNNLAILGTVEHRVFNKSNLHVVTTQIEHPSVLEPLRELERRGAAVTYLPVDRGGRVDLEALKQSLRPETVLVSVMYANNEIGTIQPLREVARIIRSFKKASRFQLPASPYPLFHTDACQAARVLDLNVTRLGVDLLTLDGGKVYGPKGSGVLFVRRGVELAPSFRGTENPAAAIGFTQALELCAKLGKREAARLGKWREQLRRGLEKIPGVKVNGTRTADVLPHILNASFDGLEAEQLVLELDARGLAVSSGSACRQNKPSYVIMALGENAARAGSAIRFSLGRDTTRSNINYALKVIKKIHARNPLAQI